MQIKLHEALSLPRHNAGYYETLRTSIDTEAAYTIPDSILQLYIWNVKKNCTKRR